MHIGVRKTLLQVYTYRASCKVLISVYDMPTGETFLNYQARTQREFKGVWTNLASFPGPTKERRGPGTKSIYNVERRVAHLCI